MENTLKRICELQPRYSSSNTNEMAERGRLIRQTLVGDIRDLFPKLTAALEEYAEDLSVEGSDGIGRKTEAPWVRIYSKNMSPSAREGYYIVIHFAADGSAVFLTIGCGSTIWANGDLTAISDAELQARTDWARQVIIQRFSNLEPFTDKIVIGARAPLPRTFEKATAFAKRYSASNVNDDEFSNDLYLAAHRLREIYRAQKMGRDISPGTQDEFLVRQTIRPRKSGQGFGLSSIERKIVELRAMLLSLKWLEVQGYKVEDVSANHSYDFRAVKDGTELYIEVKGTTSDNCSSIMMTRNEVEFHRTKKGLTGLMIVSSIRLIKKDDQTVAEQGTLEALIGWDIDEWLIDPIAYQLTRR